jgi:hypothetical protein
MRPPSSRIAQKERPSKLKKLRTELLGRKVEKKYSGIR